MMAVTMMSASHSTQQYRHAVPSHLPHHSSVKGVLLIITGKRCVWKFSLPVQGLSRLRAGGKKTSSEVPAIAQMSNHEDLTWPRRHFRDKVTRMGGWLDV